MFCYREHPRVVAIVVAFLFFPFFGCEREVRLRVTKEMTWECAPEHYMAAYPEAQPVRFRYVENPHHEVVQSGRGLCDQLKNTGKPLAAVEFELFGDRVRGLRGFNAIAVDGRPIVEVGGWGGNGGDASTLGDPLETAFRDEVSKAK
jgi:hypothetical protein